MFTINNWKQLPAWAIVRNRNSYALLNTDNQAILDSAGSTYQHFISWRFVMILFITNIVSITTTLYYTHQYSLPNLAMDLELTSLTYPSVDRSLALQSFSRFYPSGASQYTETAGPEVDDAWHRIGVRNMTFLLPGALGDQYGLNPQSFMYVRKGVWHNDSEGYPVSLQVLHDLHCVNMIRKSIYYNYPYYEKTLRHRDQPEIVLKGHINHCVDAIRERVMCTADMGIIPYGWPKPDEGAKPYFQTQHKCHNFDSVLRWAREHVEPHNVAQKIRVPVPPDARFDVVGW